jgi:uncharacterized protein (UPF0261 family)
MPKTVAIIGSLDTKGSEFGFLKDQIERLGCKTLVINVGVLGEPAFLPDISAQDVAAAAGFELAELITQRDRGRSLDAMTLGVSSVAKKAYDEGRFDGIISMGGGGGTAMGTSAMRALPIGIPKLMVSTVASGDTSPCVGSVDII